MAYTGAQIDAAAAALARAAAGLHLDVAHAWVTAEQGDDNNMVGVTYTDASGQHLYQYPSLTAGAQAAAHLIATGPYAGIRAALATGDSQRQAQAIIASPWNHPYYSNGSGAAALREIAAGVPADVPPIATSVRVTGTFETYTVDTAKNAVVGHSKRRVPGAAAVNDVYRLSPRRPVAYRGMALRQLVTGKYAGQWVNPHGALRASA
jgi:hypothetical protein